VHEQGQPVGRRDVCGAPARVGLERLDDLDIPGVELPAQLGNLVVAEVLLDNERVELTLLDCSALLDFLEEVVRRCFQNGAQFLLTSLCVPGSGPISGDGGTLKPLLSAAN
jgi:hypothetical protein